MNVLKTDRLDVRGFIPEDAQLLYEYHREDCIKEELPDEVFESLEHTQNLLADLTENYESLSYPLVFAVVRSEDNQLIGHVGLSEMPKGKIEIGYAISERFQKNGYAKEVIKPFAEWAISSIGLTEIYAIVKKSNSASCRVLENAGFTFLKEDVKDLFGKTNVCVKTYLFK